MPKIFRRSGKRRRSPWAWFLALTAVGSFYGVVFGFVARQVGVMLVSLTVILTLTGLGIVLIELDARRQAKLRSGRCIGCGYDLRECKVQCPECGRAVPEGHRTNREAIAELEKL